MSSFLELLRTVIISGHARSSRPVMNLLYVPADVARLREARATYVALEGACARVLAEVVTQIARLGEDRVAAVVHASEIHFDALCYLVAHLNVLM